MLRKFLILVVIIKCTSLRESDAHSSIGDNCSIPNSEVPGECKLLASCPEANEKNQNKSTQPSQCRFTGLDVMVCCAKQEDIVPTQLTHLKRVQKCNEYAKLAYEEGQSKTNACGINADPPNVDSDLARSREFPHFALLGYTGTNTEFEEIFWYGGGSLISTRFVLTAGHLLNPRHYGPVRKIRLGNFDDERFSTDILVEMLISHPDFHPPTLYHDIGLIKLTEKVKFSPDIHPICMPVDDTVPSNGLIETGWETNTKYEPAINKLHRDVINVITNGECSLHYLYNISRVQRQGIISEQMCTTFNSKHRNFCRGDMLQIQHPDTYCMYIQIGVISYGHECHPDVPTLFTRVFAYTDWIEDVIWGSGQDE